MGLQTNLLRGIYSLGYEIPSFIQQRAIVPVYQGHDCICQAQSGTGKTAAFCTAILQLIDASVREPQAIVLSPTRHLAQQTHKVMKDLALHMDVNVHLLIGGLGQPSNRAHASMLADGVHCETSDCSTWRHRSMRPIHLDHLHFIFFNAYFLMCLMTLRRPQTDQG